jgi:hypothetical protein
MMLLAREYRPMLGGGRLRRTVSVQIRGTRSDRSLDRSAARLRGGSSLCSLLDGVDAVVAGAALIDAARKPGDVPASLGDECPSLAVRVTARERK